MNGHQVLLAAEDLDIRRGAARVLDVPRLAIRQAEVACLVGPNGSGKTTLLLSLAGLLAPQAGRLLFRQAPVSAGSALLAFRRKTATVFQEPLLFDTTVYGNVAAGLKIRGFARDEVHRRVELNLERFRISHLAARSARKLSGGEAQRASLARAFATEPELLFLDEPFSALDPPTREALISDLDRIFRETGIAVVMATHDQTEALRLADTMAVLRQGRIVQQGPPEEVMNFPADEFVAGFVGMGTVLKGLVAQAIGGTVRVRVGDQVIECIGEAAPGQEVILCIRPENVTLHPPDHHDISSARNHFAGRVTRLIPMGHVMRAQLDCGFFLEAHVTAESCRTFALSEGRPVSASFKATAVHMITHAIKEQK